MSNKLKLENHFGSVIQVATSQGHNLLLALPRMHRCRCTFLLRISGVSGFAVLDCCPSADKHSRGELVMAYSSAGTPTAGSLCFSTCSSAPIQLRPSTAMVDGELVEDTTEEGGCHRPGVQPSSSCDEMMAGMAWMTSRMGAEC